MWCLRFDQQRRNSDLFECIHLNTPVYFIYTGVTAYQGPSPKQTALTIRLNPVQNHLDVADFYDTNTRCACCCAAFHTALQHQAEKNITMLPSASAVLLVCSSHPYQSNTQTAIWQMVSKFSTFSCQLCCCWTFLVYKTPYYLSIMLAMQSH